MDSGRNLDMKLVFLAFLVATFIFLSGFLLSYMVSYSKYQSVSTSQEEIRYRLLSLELEKQILSSSCEVFNPFLFSEELDRMGSLIGILEKKFGRHDKIVLKQKEIYSMLETQHFLLIKENNNQCNTKTQIIFFFYSNLENFIDQADKIGFILSSFKKENPDVMVYSFDYDLETNLINILKRRYNISEANTVVINEETNIVNLSNIEDLRKLEMMN